MKLKVGDKVLMDRNSNYFKDEILTATSKSTESLAKVFWWTELEEQEFLVIEEMEHMFDDIYAITLEDFDYSVSSHWIKHLNK